MMIHQGDTQVHNEEIIRCEDVEELKEILNQNSNYYLNWKYYINRLIEKNHFNYVQMGKLCSTSKNTVKRWCREGKIPQNREAFFKIALGLRMSVEQTNDLLQRFGKYPALYAKCMGDAILIYVLQHPQDKIEPYEYYTLLSKYCLSYFKTEKKRVHRKEVDTNIMYQELIEQENEMEFLNYIKKYQEIFENSFHKLVDYIESYIRAKNANIHEFVEEHGLNAAFDKMLSNLRNKGEVPNRMKLIILGVHLNMSMDELNHMLDLAYMEPLCAKDKIESIIMYAMESAYLNNPGYAYENAVALKDVVKDEAWREKCLKIIKDYWSCAAYGEVSVTEEFEVLEESISSYLKWILQEMDMEDEEIMELL